MDDKELERGFHLVLTNATSLINEAKLLIEHGFFARGYALAQLAIEETGKCILLDAAILHFYLGEEINHSHLEKKGFFKHKDKTKLSLKSQIIAIKMFEQSIGEKTNLRESVIDDFQRLTELNILKNQSLYVDIVDDKFIHPNEIIDESMARKILEKAQLRFAATKPLLKPLTKIKESSSILQEALKNPEKIKEMKQKILEEYGIEVAN